MANLSLVPELGQVYEHRRVFTRLDVLEFAKLTGDEGIHHIDSDGPVICQGLLVASVVTKIGGDMNYLAKSMEFEMKQPVYQDESIVGQLTITKLIKKHRRYKLAMECKCFNQEGKVVLEGITEGQILIPME